MLNLTIEEDSVLLPVKIVPGSSKTRCLGIWDGRARIAVSAPPEKGKANQAIVGFLAKLLNVRRRQITIVAGHSTPLKTIRIDQVSEHAIREAFPSDRPRSTRP